MAQVLPIFSLAKLQGLVSEVGIRINGRYAVVTGHHRNGKEVRNLVYILGRSRRDNNECRVKTENLLQVNPAELNEKILDQYKRTLSRELKLCRTIERPWRKKKILQAMCSIPGYTPSMEIRCQYAHILLEVEEYKPAIELLIPLEDEALQQGHAMTSKIRTYLALCYLKSGRFCDSLDAVQRIRVINQVSGKDRRILSKTLEKLAKRLFEFESPRLLEACKAGEKMFPRDGIALNNAGVLLCCDGQLEEGQQFFIRAIGIEGWKAPYEKRLVAQNQRAVKSGVRNAEKRGPRFTTIKRGDLLLLDEVDDC